MGNHKIKMNISIYDEMDNISKIISVDSKGIIQESECVDINAVEKAFLKANKELMKKSIPAYLEEISKKKAEDKQEAYGGEIIQNEREYKVDSEIGRFAFNTHKLINEEGVKFDTSKDIFKAQRNLEWYETDGFYELGFSLVIDESYRKSANKLNRVRREEVNGGTPTRTLASIVEIEAGKIASKIDNKTAEILAENNFSEEGMPKEPEREYGVNIENAAIKKNEIKEAQENYNKNEAEKGYEISDRQCEKIYIKTDETAKISIDDVLVKKQVEHRKKDEKKVKKNVKNTVVHIEFKKDKYYINGGSVLEAIIRTIAFLIYNRLINNYIEFYVDGERTLHSTILEKFIWHKSFRIILDWYHLEKKCGELLSSALKGRKIRNEVLKEITSYLWIGEVGLAKAVLSRIDKDQIKSPEHIEQLIKYFERNEQNIPCYALRRELGLRSSSNRGEKSNDLIVAERQKHNGMSWSKCGSISLATITTLKLNKELHKWLSQGEIEFKLVS